MIKKIRRRCISFAADLKLEGTHSVNANLADFAIEENA